MREMRVALGLFHFNPYWNLDTRSAHRHCTDTFVPLLRTILAHPKWHVTIEMAGIGLEFIQNSYPEQMKLLRTLVDSGQVELISSLYTPNIWIAFPARDLLRAVSLNMKCLDKLKLPQSRIFFAQEGFFGAGVSVLADYFDVAVCKDDYLSYYYELDFRNPCFTVNGMKVIAASNHLLNELSQAMAANPAFVARHQLLDSHRRHLQRSSELNRPENFPSAAGEWGGTAWKWYHCGDGNHFGTMYKPDDLERCYYDHVWSSMCEKQIESYEAAGYQLASIGEFVASLDFAKAQELPMLVEGAWNPRLSEGIFRWMGSNDTPWENDAAVLASTARARARLVATERANPDQEVLQQAWGSLLQAQISDALGWFAGPQAVSHALRASDDVLFMISQVACDAALYDADILAICMQSRRAAAPFLAQRPVAELFGAEGAGSYTPVGPGIEIYDCEFTMVAQRAGIQFGFEMMELVYCPSGLESAATHIPSGLLKPRSVSLPLANGLLQIAPDVFLIKDTRRVHVAATIDFDRQKVTFSVRDTAAGKQFSWRFYVVTGPLSDAIQIANTLNFV
jgi:hypothetical protein